jgi:flagellin
LFNGTVDVASAANVNIAVQMGFGAGDKVTFTLSALDTASLSLDATKGIGTAASATAMITEADEALTQLAKNRAMAGAAINRLEHTVSNLMNVVQRTEEARSRIEDADFASESAALARANVLTQAGTAMLAQANQSPQYLLALLR